MALIFKIIPSSIEIIVTSISLEIPIQGLKNNKLDPCPVPFVKNDLILKPAVTWPDSSSFCTSKINSAYWFTQSFSKICYHTTGHNADITSPRVLLCWPVLVNVMIWVKRLFAVKYFGILLTNCLLSFFLSLCTPITCLITNNKTKNNRLRQKFAIILIIYPLSHYCESQCWFHRAGEIQGDCKLTWESGMRVSQSKKIPSPNDILFYPCSHRVNPPRLSSLNEINEAASRKNRDYEWLALERIECTTPKLKGPAGWAAGWPSGQHVRIANQLSWVWLLLWPLAGFVSYILFEFCLLYYLIRGLTALPP